MIAQTSNVKLSSHIKILEPAMYVEEIKKMKAGN